MKINAPNAALWLFPDFIKQQQSHQLFNHLQAQLAWQQDSINMYGKTLAIPRLQAWYGNKGLNYQYSGIQLTPTPWLPILQKIVQSLNQQCQGVLQQPVNFNALLANLYRDNNDAVSWHSDDEPELGDNPIIASVSLGATRDFKLKHKTLNEKLTIPLTSGSLLLMAGETQHYWQHAILRSKTKIAPRINLTFREIKTR